MMKVNGANLMLKVERNLDCILTNSVILLRSKTLYPTNENIRINNIKMG